MNDLLKLARIQFLIVILFIFFKFIRPSVLDSNALIFFKVILLSLPNFFEAVLGILTLTGLGLYIQNKILPTQKQIRANTLYLLATILTAIYVITQELKIHNLGGNNVFDLNDLIFSGIGLVTGYLLVIWIQPKISTP